MSALTSRRQAEFQQIKEKVNEILSDPKKKKQAEKVMADFHK